MEEEEEMEFSKIKTLCIEATWAIGSTGGAMSKEFQEKTDFYINKIEEIMCAHTKVSPSNWHNLPDNTEVPEELEKIHNEFKRWIMEDSGYKGLAKELELKEEQHLL